MTAEIAAYLYIVVNFVGLVILLWCGQKFMDWKDEREEKKKEKK